LVQSAEGWPCPARRDLPTDQKVDRNKWPADMQWMVSYRVCSCHQPAEGYSVWEHQSDTLAVDSVLK